MMRECEEGPAEGGNPFDDSVAPDQQNGPGADYDAATTQSLATVSTEDAQNMGHSSPNSPKANPFVAENESCAGNPFGPLETNNDMHTKYENISLLAPTVGAIHIQQRDWDAEWEHVASCVKKNFTSVSVVSPEVVSSMMSKHVVYTVKSEPQKYVVRRRYNDFAWLRDNLAATYEGLFIPSIPATTVFTKNPLSGGSKTDVNGDFVKNRMQQLQLFMDLLCSIPFLRTDPSIHCFLSVQNEKEFKQITEAPVSVTNGGGVDNWTNVGLNMWIKIVDNTVINPVAAERLVGDFKRQLDLLAQRLHHMDNECRAAGKKAVVCAAAMGSLSDQVSAWAATEADLIDPQRNEYVDPYGKTKHAQIEGLAHGHAHWAHTTGMTPKILARLLMSNVQFQQVQVSRFREHLAMRDHLVKDLERAEREKLKAQEDRQRAVSPGTAGKRQGRPMIFSKGPGELDEILARKTEAAAQLQAKLDRITRALTFCEIHRFNKDRQQSITGLVGALAAAHLQMAQATTARWTELATQLAVDVSQYSERASTLLASAGALDEDLLGFNGGSSDAH